MHRNVTPEAVDQKLQQLQKQHTLKGNEQRQIGVDTLAVLFDTSFDQMMNIIHILAAQGKLTIHYRTSPGLKTGKNKVVYVTVTR